MTGHDTWRDQIERALAGWGTWRSRQAQLDAIMPILDAAVAEARAETQAELAAQVAATTTHSYGEVMRALRDMSDRDQQVRAEMAKEIAKLMDAEAEKSFPGTFNRGWWLQAADLVRQHAGRCCDLHNRNCEPPSELCCWRCTEANHPDHPPGEQCIAPDLSGSGQP